MRCRPAVSTTKPFVGAPADFAASTSLPTTTFDWTSKGTFLEVCLNGHVLSAFQCFSTLTQALPRNLCEHCHIHEPRLSNGHMAQPRSPETSRTVSTLSNSSWAKGVHSARTPARPHQSSQGSTRSSESQASIRHQVIRRPDDGRTVISSGGAYRIRLFQGTIDQLKQGDVVQVDTAWQQLRQQYSSEVFLRNFLRNSPLIL